MPALVGGIMRTPFLCWTSAVVLACAVPVAAQSVWLSGRLVNSLSGEPIPGAIVVLDETDAEVRSAADGTFAFEQVAPGEYHVLVKAQGYSARRTEVRVGTAAAMVDVLVDPELHFEDVVSVSPSARSQFDSYQPTSVLAGQDLTKDLQASIGDTLQTQPGVAARSFGPAPARPVIRGLDGDRVLILQDGQRLGDLSSQSGDHGVAVNPAAAKRIEVVRGPATLLYGANAIGGLVNVITDEIPTEPQDGVHGTFTADVGSAAMQGAGAADLHVGNGTFALHAGGGGRGSGDVDTPLGDLANSQARSAFGNIGAAWTSERAFAGASYGYDDSRYGVPIVESGQLELTPRRHSITARAGVTALTGFVDSLRATVGHRRYRHDELDAGEVGTAFFNRTTELEAVASHRIARRLKGSFGAWVLDRAFDARGAEALAPAVDQQGFAGFFYEEVAWPHLTFQFGGRIDHTRFAPFGEGHRRFTTASGSVGVLLQPRAANDALTIAVSIARAARNPALEELFFFGEHHGNFAFEVGNPALAAEKAIGIDVSLRWRSSRASGEITYFRNDIGDYIFRNPLDEETFEAREPEFAARFASRTFDHGSHGHDGEAAELQFIEFVSADSLLQGLEAHADLHVTQALVLEVGADYVRGTRKAAGEPLPRIPPFRVRTGLRFQRAAFQAGGEVLAAASQDRVFGAELPTDGYATVKLYAAYSFQAGRALHTITGRVENTGDTLYRNHLSLIKELAPETGRDFKLLYNLAF